MDEFQFLITMQLHIHRTHSDDRREGNYDIFPGFPGDVNFTKHLTGVIPAELHMHKKHTDYFAVAKGRVLFRLVYDDGRPEEKFVLSDNDNKTLIVPPGIWHNYMALEPSIMVFYINHKFDRSDEFQRPVDAAGWKAA